MQRVIVAPYSFSACEAEFLCQVKTISSDEPVVIDMQHVSGFLKPQDIMLLFLVTRAMAEQTGYQVELIHMKSEHLHYLERINFFVTGEKWVFTQQSAVEPWLRSLASPTCLELVQVATSQDVYSAIQRLRDIIETSLGHKITPDGADEIVLVVSELCDNVIEHSGQPGYVMVQRYFYHFDNVIEIHVAVGDVGKGIRRSLTDVYGAIGTTDADYICSALNGKSARGECKGGAGLLRVNGAASLVRLRSGTGVVQREGDHERLWSGLPSFAGTQAAVVLRQDISKAING